jgi:hypothetical protein
LSLSPFEKGKLKIAAHVREELDRVGLVAQSIRCKSGGMDTHRNTARLTVTVDGVESHLDLESEEVEECEAIVAGEVWRKVDGLIARIRSRGGNLRTSR